MFSLFNILITAAVAVPFLYLCVSLVTWIGFRKIALCVVILRYGYDFFL